MADWLACNTGGRFATAPDFEPDVSLALISALHFKDTWLDPNGVEGAAFTLIVVTDGCSPEEWETPSESVRVVFDRPYASPCSVARAPPCSLAFMRVGRAMRRCASVALPMRYTSREKISRKVGTTAEKN